MKMSMENPGSAPEQEVGPEADDAEKIRELISLFEARRAQDGRVDPLDDEATLAAAAKAIEAERAKFGISPPGRRADGYRDAA